MVIKAHRHAASYVSLDHNEAFMLRDLEIRNTLRFNKMAQSLKTTQSNVLYRVLNFTEVCWWNWHPATVVKGEEQAHHDVIKWKHFPRYWPFVRGIYRSPVNSPHKGQWRGCFDISLICALNKRLSKQSWGWWFETPISLIMTSL